MTAPLHYASPLPWYRAGRTQRIIIRLLILSALACGGIWAFRFAQQLQFLFEQHQWMKYTMPKEKVVAAEGTSEVPQLLATAGYHRIDHGSDSSAKAVAGNPPKEIASLDWAPVCTVVFLHRLQCPEHDARLVSVILDGPGNRLGWEQELAALAQVPANLQPGSRPIPCAPAGVSGRFSFFADTFRLFAGQPDPADESHFTIRYDLDGKSNVIDGWLMPDDTVKLEPRK
jgi:hypothetical protein